MLSKIFKAISAQLNKLANLFWEADPIAVMQLEADQAVEHLKEGREGLEVYRGLVERVQRQVTSGRNHVQKLEAQIKAYLSAGDRQTAARFALELQKAKRELEANEDQLRMHEQAYENNLKKIQHANKKLIEVREKIRRYDAEIARLAESFQVDVTTDFGQIEDVIQRQIDENRGKVRVAADLSSYGIAEIEAEERMEESLAEDVLRSFEVELGLVTPETTPIAPLNKDLGPATEEAAT